MNQNFKDNLFNVPQDNSRQDAIEELLVHNNELIYQSWELSQRFEEIKSQDLGGTSGIEELQRCADIFCKNQPGFAEWVQNLFQNATSMTAKESHASNTVSIQNTPASTASTDLNRILHKHRRSFI